MLLLVRFFAFGLSSVPAAVLSVSLFTDTDARARTRTHACTHIHMAHWPNAFDQSSDRPGSVIMGLNPLSKQ